MIKAGKKFWREIRQVVQEVTWPNRQTLIQLTVVVIFISVITGTALAAADFVFTKLIGWLTFR